VTRPAEFVAIDAETPRGILGEPVAAEDVDRRQQSTGRVIDRRLPVDPGA
jgi:hypothetical protein